MNYLKQTKEFSLHSLFLRQEHPFCEKQCSVKQSEYQREYDQAFLTGIADRVKEQKQFLLGELHKHKIRFLDLDDLPRKQSNRSTVDVHVLKIQRCGGVVTYRVTIGIYVLDVVMLNIRERSRKFDRKQIAKGTFGQILSGCRQQGSFVYKRIDFRGKQPILKQMRDGMTWEITANHRQIYDMALEYAFAVLCSALRVGPQVRLHNSFDLVCFEDSIQFEMEQCRQIDHMPTSRQSFTTRMLYCLRVMHQFGLIHKDIKPLNMAYSGVLGEFVFLDFGVSEWVDSKPGQLTLTYREGTNRYMSREMKMVPASRKGEIDLFWNDLYALRKSIADIKFNATSKKPLGRIEHSAISVEDSLTSWLFERHFGRGDDNKPQGEFGEAVRKELKCLGSLKTTFPVLYDFAPSAPQDVNTNIAEFIVRSVGMKIDIVPQLQPLKQGSLKITKLLANLRSEQVVSSTESDFYIQTEVLQRWQLLQIYDKLLRKFQACSSADQPEPDCIIDQIGILLHIASVHFVNSDCVASESDCIDTLSKIVGLEAILLVRQRWIGQAKWLLELLQGGNCLPPSTKDIFVQPLSDEAEDLIIGCIITRYTRGFVGVAVQLSELLVRQKSGIDGNHISQRRRVLDSLETVMRRTKPTSKRWLVIGSFVVSKLSKNGDYAYVVRTYQPLVQQFPYGSEQQTMLCFLLAYALYYAREYKLALHYCQRSIEMMRHIPTTVGIIRSEVHMITICERLGDDTNTLTHIQRTLDSMQKRNLSAFDQLSVKQQMFHLLMRTSRIQEAGRTLEYMTDNVLVPHFFSLPRSYTIMIDYLGCLGVYQKQKDTPEIIRKVLEFIYTGLSEEHEKGDCQESLQKKVKCLIVLASISLKVLKDALKVLDKAARILTAFAYFQLHGTALVDVGNRSQEFLVLAQRYFLLSDRTDNEIYGFVVRDELLTSYAYILLLFRFLVLMDEQSAITLILSLRNSTQVNRFIQSSPTLNVLIRQLSRTLIAQKYHRAALLLLETHDEASKGQDHQLKLGLLFLLKEYDKCVAVYTSLLSSQHNDRKMAELHQNLSQVYGLMPGKQQLFRHHLTEGNRLCQMLHKERPDDVELWLNIGATEYKLGNIKAAIPWLERVVFSGQLEEADRASAVVMFATALNSVGKCKRSAYYFNIVLKNPLCRRTKVECLFYLVHNLYILKQKPKVTKSTALLLAADKVGEYSKCLRDFYMSKGQELRAVIMSEELGPPTAKHPHLLKWMAFNNSGVLPQSNTMDDIQMMVIEKRAGRFGRLLKKYAPEGRGDLISKLKRRHALLKRALQ